MTWKAPVEISTPASASLITVAAGFPTTTATSMGTFGTGLPPGAHGLAGYLVVDPATGRVFNELTWKDGPNPQAWQPNPTVFERADAAGLRPAMIGPGYFDGSGLTNAALRGATFYPAEGLDDRVDAALAATRRGHRLVYLYWGEIDKAGAVRPGTRRTGGGTDRGPPPRARGRFALSPGPRPLPP